MFRLLTEKNFLHTFMYSLLNQKCITGLHFGVFMLYQLIFLLEIPLLNFTCFFPHAIES